MGEIDPGTIQNVEFITAEIPQIPPAAKMADIRSASHVEKRNGERSSDETALNPYGEGRGRTRTRTRKPRCPFERRLEASRKFSSATDPLIQEAESSRVEKTNDNFRKTKIHRTSRDEIEEDRAEKRVVKDTRKPNEIIGNHAAELKPLPDVPNKENKDIIPPQRGRRRAEVKARKEAGLLSSHSNQAAGPSQSAGRQKDIVDGNEEPPDRVVKDSETEAAESGKIRTNQYEVFSKRGSLLSPTFLIMD